MYFSQPITGPRAQEERPRSQRHPEREDGQGDVVGHYGQREEALVGLFSQFELRPELGDVGLGLEVAYHEQQHDERPHQEDEEPAVLLYNMLLAGHNAPSERVLRDAEPPAWQ